jgi:parallel beta-helix repeat protein
MESMIYSYMNGMVVFMDLEAMDQARDLNHCNTVPRQVKANFNPVLPLLLSLLLLIFFTGCQAVTDHDDDSDPDTDDVNTFYVSVHGNDADNGSKTAPWESIQYGLNRMKGGETLIILAGTYYEELLVQDKISSGERIMVKGEDQEKVILDGSKISRDLFFVENSSYITLMNVTVQNAPRAAIRLSYADHIIISDCIIKDNGRWGVFTDFSDYTEIRNNRVSGSKAEHGIYISNSSDFAQIEKNWVFSNVASGIQINADPSMGGDGISTDCIIDSNLIYENGRGGGAAINLASVQNSVIQNNILFHNLAGGIAAWDDDQGQEWGSSNLKITHNTIYFKENEGRWGISLKNGSHSAMVCNNIVQGGRRGSFEYDSSIVFGLEIDYNIYFRQSSENVINQDEGWEYTLNQWKQLGFDSHSFIASPQALFMDLSLSDFHLKPGSAAINTGNDCHIAFDYEGDSRPFENQVDIGADEWHK